MTQNKDNLIVFDWNGTMIADTSACLNAMNTVLKTLNKPAITLSHYQHHYTMPLANLYHALGIDAEVLKSREHEIHPLWHSTYGAANIRLRRGAKAMLNSLRLAKYDSIILSNYVVQRIDAQARKLGVRDHFSHIIAFEVGDATFRKRGKGERLRDYLKQRPIRTGMIVGDSEEEVEIGRELGLATVAITDGMCSVARLRAMKPDFLVRSLDQILAITHKVFGTEMGILS